MKPKRSIYWETRWHLFHRGHLLNAKPLNPNPAEDLQLQAEVQLGFVSLLHFLAQKMSADTTPRRNTKPFFLSSAYPSFVFCTCVTIVLQEQEYRVTERLISALSAAYSVDHIAKPLYSTRSLEFSTISMWNPKKNTLPNTTHVRMFNLRQTSQHMLVLLYIWGCCVCTNRRMVERLVLGDRTPNKHGLLVNVREKWQCLLHHRSLFLLYGKLLTTQLDRLITPSIPPIPHPHRQAGAGKTFLSVYVISKGILV